MHAKFQHRHLLTLYGPHRHLVWIVDQRLCDCFDQFLHVALPSTQLILESRYGKGVLEQMIATRTGLNAATARVSSALARDFRRLLKQALNRLGRLGAPANPIVCAFFIKDQLRRMPARIVVTNYLQEAPIACLLAINDHNSVTDLFLGSCSSQTYP